MSDTIEFNGAIAFDRPVTQEHRNEYLAFVEDCEVNGDNCPWEIAEDGDYLEWSSYASGFAYQMVNNLKKIIKEFFQVREYKLNGGVEWRGGEWEDTGEISIDDNVVSSTLDKNYREEDEARTIQVLINLQGGTVTVMATTDKRIRVTIIDHDTEGRDPAGPQIIQDHSAKITTPNKMESYISDIRNKTNQLTEL